jgi:hypothetical protein
MQIKIQDNTVIISILDDESNSSDKDAFLDMLILNYQVTDRTFKANRIEYRIDKAIWNDKEFQKKFMWLELSL